ncbi:MAG: DUF692 domain-containing protein [Pseudomonadota bacterium]
MSGFASDARIPSRAGVGLKAEHYAEIEAGGFETDGAAWFEIHAENYMGDGGPPHAHLRKIRDQFPISVHGVGLSIGAEVGVDPEHLSRLAKVVADYQPGLFSEHLAWSTHETGFLNDLLPVPYTEAVVERVSAHIAQVQDAVGRRMLLENPSTYVRFETSTMSELDFLKEVADRSDCGLLLDINNVFVSATNHGYSPEEYLDAFPLERVGEIHLGGHAEDEDDLGDRLLIDAHDREVADPVWTLYERVVATIGPRPTLIEWDNEVPAWAELNAEARRANRVLDKYRDLAGRGHADAA